MKILLCWELYNALFPFLRETLESQVREESQEEQGPLDPVACEEKR